ncbi:MAG: DUF2062 domain-containing protein, partial [Cyanothece sp. SIO1E1]|nr:DUF2062 domain-containing protein [Cyanothece sp. SIO1E1]
MQGTPKTLARGLAAGVFAGCFPLLGLQTIIGIMLATLMRGNKIMAAAGTWVSNPLTYVPIYALNFQVGKWFLGSTEQDYNLSGPQSWDAITSMGADLTTTLLVGCTVMG